MSTEILEQSVDDLMCECFNTALKVAYIDDSYCKTRPKPESISDSFFDEIWLWVDGLYQKGFFDRMEGRCSFKESLEFSMEDEERYMWEFLTKLKAIS